MIRVVYLFLSCILFTALSCSNSDRVDALAQNETTTATPNTAAIIDNRSTLRPQPTKTITGSDKDLKTVLPITGCWSGGDRNGTVIRITKDTFQTRISNGPIKFRLISRSGEAVFLIELKLPDPSNAFKRIIKAQLEDQNTLILNDYESIESFEANGQYGEIRLFRDDCRTLTNVFE